jgi:hypothetical protein
MHGALPLSGREFAFGVRTTRIVFDRHSLAERRIPALIHDAAISWRADGSVVRMSRASALRRRNSSGVDAIDEPHAYAFGGQEVAGQRQLFGAID